MVLISSLRTAEKQGANLVNPPRILRLDDQSTSGVLSPAPGLDDAMTSTPMSPIPFLTAEWRHLVMANYEVDPKVLQPYVPRGTELDYFEGACLVSVVGFMFERSKLLGRIAVPWHSCFEEVNLRFYVRRHVDGECRRAVVFLKELAASRSVRIIANWWFSEHYQTVELDHKFDWTDPADQAIGGNFAYRWRWLDGWSTLTAETTGPLAPLLPNSLPEFVLEHYWAYGRRPTGATLEYRVEHPPWHAWPVGACRLQADTASLYGRQFAPYLSATPHSALVADGSAVKLFSAHVLKCG